MILCSGKHFYALDAYRREKGLTNTALIRLEVTSKFIHVSEVKKEKNDLHSSSQLLCPFPSGYLHQELKKYSSAKGMIVFFIIVTLSLSLLLLMTLQSSCGAKRSLKTWVLGPSSSQDLPNSLATRQATAECVAIFIML